MNIEINVPEVVSIFKEIQLSFIDEFEQDAFKALHSSPAHDKVGERVRPLFDGNPTPHFYEVLIG